MDDARPLPVVPAARMARLAWIGLAIPASRRASRRRAMRGCFAVRPMSIAPMNVPTRRSATRSRPAVLLRACAARRPGSYRGWRRVSMQPAGRLPATKRHRAPAPLHRRHRRHRVARRPASPARSGARHRRRRPVCSPLRRLPPDQHRRYAAANRRPSATRRCGRPKAAVRRAARRQSTLPSHAQSTRRRARRQSALRPSANAQRACRLPARPGRRRRAPASAGRPTARASASPLLRGTVPAAIDGSDRRRCSSQALVQ
jgi:hypothetical protein